MLGDFYLAICLSYNNNTLVLGIVDLYGHLVLKAAE